MAETDDLSPSTLELVKERHPSCNLGDFFRTSISQYPDSPAIVDLSGSSPLTLDYAGLDERIRRCVAALKAAGLAKGDRIALALPNGAMFLVAFLGAMRAGMIPVPANFNLSPEILRFILADAGCRGIIADPPAAPAFSAAADEAALTVRLSVGSDRPAWQRYEPLADQLAADPAIEAMAFDDQAFQAYTSGSTGVPKGLWMTHGGMLWGIEQSQRYWPMAHGDRRIVATPMYHKNAMRGSIKPTLRAGGSVVIMPRFEPRAFLSALADYQVTACGGVPAIFAELLRHEDLLAAKDFSRLTIITMGSSTVSVDLLQRINAAFPAADVKEGYGLTEGGAPLRQPLDGRKTPLGSVGVQAPETEAMLVGPDGERNAQQGELWIRSPYILREYVNRPDLNRDKLCDGWLRTGDLFRLDRDGFFYFVGRNDDMFVCGGENLFPKEVEGLILTHPAVAHVVVAPLPHEIKGAAPAAMIVLHAADEDAFDVRLIQDYCAAHGPAFAIPRAVLVVDEIPTNGPGKYDRQAVARILNDKFGTLRSRGASERTIKE